MNTTPFQLDLSAGKITVLRNLPVEDRAQLLTSLGIPPLQPTSATDDRAWPVGVAFLPQGGYQFLLELRVFDEVAAPLENSGWPSNKIEERVRRALMAVGLAEYAQRNPLTLSGGEIQRVLIAQAIASPSSLIILDEPFSELDAVTRSTVANLLVEMLPTEGRAALIFTDHWEDALSKADFVYQAPSGPMPVAENFVLANSPRDPFSNNEVFLQLCDLTYSQDYGRTDLFSRLNLKIHKGERIALLGRNGVGKSTLLSILLGLEISALQSLFISGKRATKKAVTQLHSVTGAALQACQHIFFCNTVVEELRDCSLKCLTGSNSADLTADEDRIHQYAVALGLNAHNHELIDKLAPPLRRVLATACAMIAGRQLVVLDEPTAGLPPQSTCQISQLLRRLLPAETTLVLVTHDFSLAAAVADRFVILQRGTIACDHTFNDIEDRLSTLELRWRETIARGID